MGATYTRQSTYTEGDIIQASDTNDEFDQLLAAFAASTGHTHDGTTGEGGPISTLAGHGLTFGAGTAGTDITITFDGETNDGVLKWMEDEDYFEFSDDILVASSEKLQFRDTALYINSSTDGQLDIVADTLVQVATAAFTVDASGDITLDAGGADVVLKDDGTTFGSLTNSSGELVIKSGSTPTAALTFSGANITAEGNLTVDGNLDVTGTFDLSDSNFTNAGDISLDSISGDADSNTSIAFSGSDVITITTGGETQVTFNNGSILPTTDDDVDLGSSALQFKDLYIDGTANIDTGSIDTANVGALTVSGSTTLGATSFGDADITNVGSIALDTITNDGTDITLDSGGDIILDAAGNEVFFKASGTSILTLKNDSSDAVLTVETADKNFTIKGTDDSSAITALDIDMALAGKATFNGDVVVGGDLTISGDDLTMATNTAGALLIADGTNFNPTLVTSLSEISTAADDDVLLAVDTSGGGLKKISRSTIIAGTGVAGNISNIVEDTSPQLGGNLDLNGADIVTTSNATLDLAPNGTGTVVVRGNTNSGAIVFNCESNSHGQKVYGQPHSAGVTNTLMLPAGANSTLVSLVSTDTLTNKTLTSPKINEDVAVTSTATELNLLDGVTATTAELNILDGVTSTAAELNILDGVTSTAAELNVLDGITAVVGELNALDIGSTAVGTAVASKAVILDSDKDYTGIRNFTITGNLSVGGTTTVVNTVTMNAANAVVFEGATADAHETTLTIVDPTADRTINLPNQSGTIPVLAAASNTAVTSTPEELNILDGATVVVGEINALDLGSTAVGNAIASKAVVLDSNKDYTGLRNVTATGAVTGGSAVFDGGVAIDNITIDGTEIDLSSGDLTVDVAGDIILDAGGGDLKFAVAGTEILSVTNSSSDVIIKPIVDAKDIIFQQRDGTEVARIEDNGTFNVVTDKLAINGTAVTATAAELNLIDGGTSVGGSITLADADGFIVNDNGTMKTIPASDVKTYASGSSATKGFAIAMAIVFG